MTADLEVARPPARLVHSLAWGPPGMALSDAVTGHAGSRMLRDRVETMIGGPICADARAGLFQGAPAVAYALRMIGHPGLRSVIDRLHDAIVAATRIRLGKAHRRIDGGALPELCEFDLISGLTGIGVYLHTAGDHAALREVLAYLVRLADPLLLHDVPVPGWWTANGPGDRLDPAWPGGHANLGLAHGIAGPLALLAITHLDGIVVGGHADALERLDTWFDPWNGGTPSRPRWPGLLGKHDWIAGAAPRADPQRPSWCYGNPGTARARQLAALALADPDRRHSAETALAASIVDSDWFGTMRDDSLCHGRAGLVLLAHRAAADAEPGSELHRQAVALRHHWNQRRPSGSGTPGLLDGNAGIRLVDHTVRIDHGPRWDACLLTTSTTRKGTT